MRDTSHFSRAPIALACMSVVSTVLFGVLSSISAADVIPLASPGAVSGGGFGESVSIVPDLNGDGWKDLVIGAPREPVAGVAQAGRVHVIDGRTWAVIRTHDAPGAEAAGWFGTAVLGLPDINGDGQGDYCVGAPGQGPNDRGVVYAFSGATGALLWTALGVGGADMNGWGGCLALVPDASGDGYPELVVGHVSAPAQPATVRVLHATSGGTWKTLQKEAGGGAFTRWGHAVGGVADLNGDARGDVLIGAPNWDTNAGQDAGLVYVYSGATGEFIGEIASPGAQPFGRFGTSVAGVPDLDGDGNGDVAVGAPGEIPVALAVRCGQAHVFSGASLSGLYTVGSSEPVEQGAFGAAIAGAADMNDDGAGDIVIGAPLEGSGSSLGRVYVVSGAQGSSIRAPLASSLAGSSFGSALATGDVTHDGRPDLIAGAPQLSSFGLPNAGRAELHRIVVNDACDLDAMLPEVGEGVHTLSTVGALGGLPVSDDCSAPKEEAFLADVFLRYVPSATGIATLSTCGDITFDTRLEVYAGCSFTDSLCDLSTRFVCSDDAPECAGGGSAVTLPVRHGDCLWVRAGGTGGAQGITALTITLDTCPADLDGRGGVDGADLALLLAAWGDAGPADLDGSGAVDGADLAILLAAWGSC